MPYLAASAAESVGGCVVKAVREAEALDLSDEEIEVRATEAVELCIAAPNPILPEASEVVWGNLGLAGLLITGAILVRVLLSWRKSAAE